MTQEQFREDMHKEQVAILNNVWSKAEEQALKAYPKRGWKCKDAEGNDKFLDANRECRLAFVKGYEQASKDYIEYAQLWVDSGEVNIKSFKQFLKDRGYE